MSYYHQQKSLLSSYFQSSYQHLSSCPFCKLSLQPSSLYSHINYLSCSYLKSVPIDQQKINISLFTSLKHQYSSSSISKYSSLPPTKTPELELASTIVALLGYQFKCSAGHKQLHYWCLLFSGQQAWVCHTFLKKSTVGAKWIKRGQRMRSKGALPEVPEEKRKEEPAREPFTVPEYPAESASDSVQSDSEESSSSESDCSSTPNTVSQEEDSDSEHSSREEEEASSSEQDSQSDSEYQVSSSSEPTDDSEYSCIDEPVSAPQQHPIRWKQLARHSVKEIQELQRWMSKHSQETQYRIKGAVLSMIRFALNTLTLSVKSFYQKTSLSLYFQSLQVNQEFWDSWSQEADRKPATVANFIDMVVLILESFKEKYYTHVQYSSTFSFLIDWWKKKGKISTGEANKFRRVYRSEQHLARIGQWVSVSLFGRLDST